MAGGRRKSGQRLGGGGGSVTHNQYAMFFEKQGPSSYATGGFVIDLSATYSSLNSLRLMLKKGTRGNLGIGRLRITLNSPTAGKATVVCEKHRYDRITAVGNVANQPAGVTVVTTSGEKGTAEATHTHATDHDHASFTSSVPTDAGGQVNLAALGPNTDAHTHTLNLPNLTGTSGAGTSHDHADDSIYQHDHAETHAVTNVAVAEIANATNLSASLWFGLATGVRA